MLDAWRVAALVGRAVIGPVSQDSSDIEVDLRGECETETHMIGPGMAASCRIGASLARNAADGQAPGLIPKVLDNDP